MRHRLIALGLAVALPGATLAAQTVDFSPIACATGSVNVFGSSISVQGYDFTQITGSSFATWCADIAFYGGSAAMFNNNFGATHRMTKTGGGTFSLNSIDLAPAYYTQYVGPISVTFVGLVASSPVATQTFSFNATGGPPAFQTFTFGGGWSSVDEVQWSQGASGDVHQFDNIVTNTIPEPASLVLVASGMMLAVAARRRRRA